jgi:uncharacterized membrane protein (UPF0127 family)
LKQSSFIPAALRVFIGLLSILILFGCTQFAVALSTQSNQHKVEFEKVKIRLASKVLEVEIADTPETREHGLMFRSHLPVDGGMLFVFPHEQSMAFWMKNTLIPLSIGYFDNHKSLIETLEMVPAVLGDIQPKTYPSSRPAMYALEMPKGWFAKQGVRPGTRFLFEAPTKSK